MNKLIIKGMHCAACLTLIRMELEEKGLAVKDIRLLEGDRGEVEFTDLTKEQLALAKEIINHLDNYSIIS